MMNRRFFAIVTVMAALIALRLPAENCINISYGDNIICFTGDEQLDTQDKIDRALKAWQNDYDGQVILWRIASDYIKRYYEQRSKDIKAYYDKVDEIYSKFNPALYVREKTRENGQKMLLYATYNDHGCPTTVKYGYSIEFAWQDKVTIAFPEYQERDLAGNFHYGVLDLSNPAARQFIVKRLVDFVDEFQADGLYLCSRSHSLPADHADQFGFGPEIVRVYQERYGIDLRSDPRFDYRKPEFAPGSQEVENWRRLRGEYYVQLVRELRQALGDRLLYLALPRGDYFGAPFGNMFIDYDTICNEKLADAIVMNVYTGRWLYAKDKVPHRDRGYLLSYDDGFNVMSMDEAISHYSPKFKKAGIRFFYSTAGFSDITRDGLDGLMIGTPTLTGSGNPRLLHAEKAPGNAFSVDFHAWLPSSVPSGGRLVSKYFNDTNSQRGWEFYYDGKSRKLNFRTYLVGQDGHVTDNALYSEIEFPLAQWVHIAGTVDPEKHRKCLYFNGQLVASTEIPEGSAINRNADVPVVFGRYGLQSDALSNAFIDEFALWNTVRQYEGTIPAKPYSGNEAGLMALLHFDDANEKPFTASPVEYKHNGTLLRVDGVFGNALVSGYKESLPDGVTLK